MKGIRTSLSGVAVALGCAMLGATISAPAAHAQSQSTANTLVPFTFGGFAGPTFPTGNYGDLASSGWHIGGTMEYRPQWWAIGVRGELVYHSLGTKDYNQSVGTTTVGFTSHPSMTAAILNGTWNFPVAQGSTVQPYAIAGVGIYRVHFENTCRSTGSVTCVGAVSETSNKFGINAGGGVEFKLTGFSTFVEARWHNVFTDNTSSSIVPLSVGIVIR